MEESVRLVAAGPSRTACALCRIPPFRSERRRCRSRRFHPHVRTPAGRHQPHLTYRELFESRIGSSPPDDGPLGSKLETCRGGPLRPLPRVDRKSPSATIHRGRQHEYADIAKRRLLPTPLRDCAADPRRSGGVASEYLKHAPSIRQLDHDDYERAGIEFLTRGRYFSVGRLAFDDDHVDATEVILRSVGLSDNHGDKHVIGGQLTSRQTVYGWEL